MVWLKRNLILVVGGAVALALLGAAGYFLFDSYRRNAVVSEELDAAAQEFTRISTRVPSAVESNVAAAKTEQERLSVMVEKNRRFFAPFGAYTNITSSEFKSLLETAIMELEDQATSAGILRQKNFSYTFDGQRGSLGFNPADLVPWAYQIEEIKALCKIIYSARVHALLALRRGTASTNEAAGDGILRGAAPTLDRTTQCMVTPYEVVFQGFTPELAAVLEAMASSSHCFVVKNINVEKAAAPAPRTAGPGAPGDAAYAARYGPAPALPGAGVNPAMERAAREANDRRALAERYGPSAGGGRGVPRGTVPVVTAPVVNPWATARGGAARRGPETVLDENLLNYTLRLEVIRPTTPVK